MRTLKVQTGTPEKTGVYVCYIDPPIKTRLFMEKCLLFYQDGDWFHLGSDQRFRGKVYCWIGHLPSPTKFDVIGKDSVMYAISSEDRAIQGSFKAGPFELLSDAAEEIGASGDFIFSITTNECKKVRKWSVKFSGWVSRKRDKINNLENH